MIPTSCLFIPEELGICAHYGTNTLPNLGIEPETPCLCCTCDHSTNEEIKYVIRRNMCDAPFWQEDGDLAPSPVWSNTRLGMMHGCLNSSGKLITCRLHKGRIEMTFFFKSLPLTRIFSCVVGAFINIQVHTHIHDTQTVNNNLCLTQRVAPCGNRTYCTLHGSQLPSPVIHQMQTVPETVTDVVRRRRRRDSDVTSREHVETGYVTELSRRYVVWFRFSARWTDDIVRSLASGYRWRAVVRQYRRPLIAANQIESDATSGSTQLANHSLKR
ncbi:hypothetical protein SFRURICE_006531, partial [Spodoptera frugiperda]